MIFIDLLIGFLKVGCFSFGGAYSAIPLIRDVVNSYGWMNNEMLAYIIAVSESTPGPIMVNLATYIGSTEGSILGAIVATLAVVLPAFIIIILITALLSKAIKNPCVQAVLGGLRACMVGVIFATGCHMVIQNVFPKAEELIDIRALIISAIVAFVYFVLPKIIKKKISPIALIGIAAVLGMVIYGI